MKLKVTGKRILLGVGLSVLFILVCVGNVASGKWTIDPAVPIAVAGALVAFAVAFTANVAGVQANTDNAQTRGHPFRGQALLFIGAVIAFLVLMKVLDALHWDGGAGFDSSHGDIHRRGASRKRCARLPVLWSGARNVMTICLER